MPSELSIARHCADLKDPRVDRTKKHRLDDILVISLCAVVCGTVASRSRHSRGVNVALADGSVRFVSDTVDLLTVWLPLATTFATSRYVSP